MFSGSIFQFLLIVLEESPFFVPPAVPQTQSSVVTFWEKFIFAKDEGYIHNSVRLAFTC